MGWSPYSRMFETVSSPAVNALLAGTMEGHVYVSHGCENVHDISCAIIVRACMSRISSPAGKTKEPPTSSYFRYLGSIALNEGRSRSYLSIMAN